MGRLKKEGNKSVLLARGGIEPYGAEIIRRAQSIGLTVKNVSLERSSLDQYHGNLNGQEFEPYFEAISKEGSGDILNLLFPVSHSFLKVIYRASDIVLANSIHEPFGLVDLEAMATGTIVFTGSGGEDYAAHFVNAIVLDTFKAEEIEFSLSAFGGIAKRVKVYVRQPEKRRNNSPGKRWLRILSENLNTRRRFRGLQGSLSR